MLNAIFLFGCSNAQSIEIISMLITYIPVLCIHIYSTILKGTKIEIVEK
jgi:hypothetical protein